MAKESNNSVKIANVGIVIIAVILIGWVLYVGKALLVNLALAVFLSYLIFPIIDFFRKKLKFPRFLAAIFSLVFIMGILTLLEYMLYTGIVEVIDTWPKYEVRFIELIENAITFANKYNIDVSGFKLLEQLNIPDIVGSSIGGVLSFVASFFLVLLFIIFILLERNAYHDKIELLTKSKGKEWVETVNSINSRIQQYITLKTIISIITGVVSYIAMKIVGLDFAIFWGLIIFLFNYIPNIGSIIASILPVLMALLQFDTVWPAVILAILFLIIQNTMGNFVEPRLFGRTFNLSPLVVLFSMLLWGSLWGVLGAILSVPIMSMLKIIMEHIKPTKGLSVLLSHYPERKK